MKRFVLAIALLSAASLATFIIAFGGANTAKGAITFNAHVHDDYFHPTGSFVPGPGHATAQALCMQANPDPTCTATIHAGDSVMWVAPAPLAANAHTVTECTDATFTVCGAGTSSPNPIEYSGVRFQPGWPYVVAFNTPGIFYYRCDIHPATMRGTVVVQSDGGVGGVTELLTGPDSSSSTPYLLLAALGLIATMGLGAGFAFRRRLSED